MYGRREGLVIGSHIDYAVSTQSVPFSYTRSSQSLHTYRADKLSKSSWNPAIYITPGMLAAQILSPPMLTTLCNKVSNCHPRQTYHIVPPAQAGENRTAGILVIALCQCCRAARIAASVYSCLHFRRTLGSGSLGCTFTDLTDVMIMMIMMALHRS
jgi:hypothetical protein